MNRIINGTLYVDVYTSLGSGQYSFTNAVFDNQADATGEGSQAVQVNFLLIVASIDPNTFLPVPGVAHRYRLITIVPGSNTDGVHLSGTIAWDEDGSEVDLPMNGSYALLTENTPNKFYNLPPSNEVYSNLPGGIIEAAYNADLWHITDKLQGLTGSQGAQGVTVNLLEGLREIQVFRV